MMLNRDDLVAGPYRFSYAQLGANIQVSDKAVFYAAHNIWIGDNTRIDDFCLLSAAPHGGGLKIGRNVHLAAYVSIQGQESVIIEDFVGISSRVAVYSSSDDYSEGHLTNPTIPAQYRGVKSSPVRIGKHSIVGSGSVILPGAELEIGVSVGALTLVNKKVPKFAIVAGNPMRLIGRRDGDKLVELEKEYVNSTRNSG